MDIFEEGETYTSQQLDESKLKADQNWGNLLSYRLATGSNIEIYFFRYKPPNAYELIFVKQRPNPHDKEIS